MGAALRTTFLFDRSQTTAHRTTQYRPLFPEKTPAEQQALCVANYESLGLAVIESGLAWWGSHAQLQHCHLRVHGLEHIVDLHKKGKGVLLLCPHFVTLEIIGRLAQAHAPLGVTFRQHKKPLLEKILRHARAKYYPYLIERNQTRSIVRSLKQQALLFYAADVDVGHKGVFAPFFDIPAATSTAPLRYAQLADAGLLLCTFYRRALGDYEAFVTPLPESIPSGDPLADLTQINAAFTEAIRREPAQYMWQYRRFKTQMGHGLSFYDR